MSHDTITITWRPPKTRNGKIIEYMITYRPADSNSSRSVTKDGKLTAVDIKNLTANTTYYIFVTAKTSKGFGGQGTIVNVTTGNSSRSVAMSLERWTCNLVFLGLTYSLCQSLDLFSVVPSLIPRLRSENGSAS